MENWMFDNIIQCETNDLFQIITIDMRKRNNL